MIPPFQAFMDEHRDDVWRFVRAVAGPGDADDCFQETFLAALRAYPTVRNATNLKSWVMTIAFRKAVDSHRSRRGRAVLVDRIPDAHTTDAGAEPDDDLWTAVQGLPPMQRAAVSYRYVNDLAYRDIAQVLSCSEDAARQNVRMGLKRLREVLSE